MPGAEYSWKSSCPAVRSRLLLCHCWSVTVGVMAQWKRPNGTIFMKPHSGWTAKLYKFHQLMTSILWVCDGRTLFITNAAPPPPPPHTTATDILLCVVMGTHVDRDIIWIIKSLYARLKRKLFNISRFRVRALQRAGGISKKNSVIGAWIGNLIKMLRSISWNISWWYWCEFNYSGVGGTE